MAQTPPDPAKPVRLGIYGGSFDPVHDGHLFVARTALQRFALDEVRFVPAAEPPHKPGRRLAPAADRVAMLELALAREQKFKVDPIELERGGISFSFDTALCLAAPNRELFLILGSDNLPGLPSWHRVGELLSLLQPIVVARTAAAGADLEAAARAFSPDQGTKLRRGFIPIEPHPGASTAVRQGGPPLGLDPAVAEYIQRRALYGRPLGER